MAVLSSLSYARLRVRQAKTGQRVRLGAVVTAVVGGGPFNDTHPFGLYARVSQRAGAPYFAYSNYPTPPMEHDTAIPAPTCTEPRFCWDRLRLFRLVCNNSGLIEERRSDSDGLDWNATDTLFTGAAHPDISADRNGLVLRAAYVSGALSIRRQYPGDAVPAVAFDAEDDGGSPLVLENDSFRIVVAPSGWWWLHWLPDGVTTTALWFSTDDGASWTETSGAVAGLTHTIHPGICCGADGTLFAYGYAAGKVKLSRRAPGDVNWSTPVLCQDSLGADLLIANQAFSMAVAYEAPRRLVLACIIAGEGLASEWGSADDGATFSRLLP